MKKSVILALAIMLTILAYFGVSSLVRGDANASTSDAGISVLAAEAEANQTIPDVVTTQLTAELHPVFLALKGRTAANRSVTVRSATTGIVIYAPDLQGRNVKAGTLLCRLDLDVRKARLAEAEALVESRRVDYDAAAELAQKGWASPNRASSARASLDAALASLNSAQIEMRRTELRAPFDGVFESRMAENGDFLSPGGACGMVTDLDPIIVEAEVTETYATSLALDAPVAVSVLGAAERTGAISYVARTANDDTRTFRVEVSLENPDGLISAGLTSDLRIQLGETLATPISPGLLTLHDDGRLGVRHVTPDGVVEFSAVTVIDDTSEGIWVTGLPERADIISFGQEYIKESARVNAVRGQANLP